MSLKNKFIYITCIVLLCSFILFNTFAFAVSDATAYVWSNQSKKLETAETSVGLNSSSATVTDNPLALDCGAACLIEQNSGLIIYDYNMHEKLRPASVTKIMSLLLIMEALDSGKIQLTDKIPCTEDAAKMGGSQIWLDVRETLTVEEMLNNYGKVSDLLQLKYYNLHNKEVLDKIDCVIHYTELMEEILYCDDINDLKRAIDDTINNINSILVDFNYANYDDLMRELYAVEMDMNLSKVGYNVDVDSVKLEEKSKLYGVDIYDFRDKQYALLAHVLSDSENIDDLIQGKSSGTFNFIY